MPRPGHVIPLSVRESRMPSSRRPGGAARTPRVAASIPSHRSLPTVPADEPGSIRHRCASARPDPHLAPTDEAPDHRQRRRTARHRRSPPSAGACSSTARQEPAHTPRDRPCHANRRRAEDHASCGSGVSPATWRRRRHRSGIGDRSLLDLVRHVISDAPFATSAHVATDTLDGRQAPGRPATNTETTSEWPGLAAHRDQRRRRSPRRQRRRV